MPMRMALPVLSSHVSLTFSNSVIFTFISLSYSTPITQPYVWLSSLHLPPPSPFPPSLPSLGVNSMPDPILCFGETIVIKTHSLYPQGTHFWLQFLFFPFSPSFAPKTPNHWFLVLRLPSALGVQNALSQSLPHLVFTLILQSIFYYCYYDK